MTSWSDSQDSWGAGAAGSWRPGSRSWSLTLPIASHQTDHLTGGGFDVPGTQSKAVSNSLEKDFGDKTGDIAVLLQAEEGAGAAARAAAVDRVRHAVAGLDKVTLPRGRRPPGRGCAAADRDGDAAAAQRKVLRSPDRFGRRTARRPRPRHRRRRGDHLPRRAADDLGRHAGALEGRPGESGGRRLPDRRDHPARRLRLARRRGAATGARLRQRDGHRGADLLHLAAGRDLGLRHQHGLDDRHRGGDRLLALHPRPLPRGAGARPRHGAGARRGALHLGPGGRLLRPRRDRLAGRPLDGRQPGAALDGAGRDDRGRRLDPDRVDAAARADRDARRPRDAGRDRRQGARRIPPPRRGERPDREASGCAGRRA